MLWSDMFWAVFLAHLIVTCLGGALLIGIELHKARKAEARYERLEGLDRRSRVAALYPLPPEPPPGYARPVRVTSVWGCPPPHCGTGLCADCLALSDSDE